MSELCVGIRGVDSLKHELDRTRESLRDTDATIEKLTGRPAFAGRPFGRGRGAPPRSAGGDTFGRGRGSVGSLFNLAGYDDTGPPPAKRGAGAFGRLGLPLANQRPVGGRRARDEDEDDDLPHKPALQSSVIATPKDTKSRQEAIAEQQSVGGGNATGRNRRMFGLLLGTLVKFKEDERTKEQQAEKRKAVELKLEEKQREERDRLKRERFQLFSDRRQQQVKLRALEQKMELVEIHSAWELETHSLENFIRTAAKPHVFFLPKSHIPESQSKLDESKRVLHNLIAERRKQLEEELEEIAKEGKEEDSEMPAEYVGSDNEADNSELAEPDAIEQRKSQPEKTADEESDLDESDMVGVDYEQSFGPEQAPAEPTPADVPEEMVHDTAEMTDADAGGNDQTDVQSQEVSQEKDLANVSVDKEDKTDVQQSEEDKEKRRKHRGDDESKEQRRRDSSRSRRHSEKHRSREGRTGHRDRRHSHSKQDKRDDDDNDRHERRRSKDDHKKKHKKKARAPSNSGSESGGKSKHSGDERDKKSP